MEVSRMVSVKDIESGKYFLCSIKLPPLFKSRKEKKMWNDIVFRVSMYDNNLGKWRRARELRPSSVYKANLRSLSPVPEASWYAEEGELFFVTYRVVIRLDELNAYLSRKVVEDFLVARKGYKDEWCTNVMLLGLTEKEINKYYLQPSLIFRRVASTARLG
jgi:hypothetical protein